MPLNVGIVGAGIAGLSAAIAMKRSGHVVEVFDKRDFRAAQEGITLAIAPNAGKVYKSWAFDLKTECGGVEAHQIRHVHGKIGAVIWKDDWNEFPELYGANVTFMRHGDLHSGLLKHLENVTGPLATLSFGVEVDQVNCEQATIRLADGSIVEKDLLILSNGLNAKFIKDITGQDCPLQDSGLSFFRYLMPSEQIWEDPSTVSLFQDQPSEICFFPYFEVGTSIVTYLCEGGKTRAVNVFARHLEENGATRERGGKISRSQLLQIAEGFHPGVQGMLQKAPDDGIYSYPLLTRDPVQKYTRGKAVMIGDAAHVMKPQMGQGASIAVESTGCLELLFRNIEKDQIVERLALFEKLRLPRCGPVHVFSNMIPTPDGYAWMCEKIKPFWDEGKPLPPPGSRPLSAPFREFIYDFDVLAETTRALEQFHETKNESHRHAPKNGYISVS